MRDETKDNEGNRNCPIPILREGLSPTRDRILFAFSISLLSGADVKTTFIPLSINQPIISAMYSSFQYLKINICIVGSYAEIPYNIKILQYHMLLSINICKMCIEIFLANKSFSAKISSQPISCTRKKRQDSSAVSPG